MNTSNLIERVVGGFDDKAQWRAYKARTKQLPADYRTAIEALQRYLMYRGAITKFDVTMSMLDDLATLFEQSVAGGTSIREVVGDNPVTFADDFLSNYTDGQWINKERARLIEAIDLVAADQ